MRQLFTDPAGNLAEAKVWANSYKAALLYLLCTHADTILKDWGVLTVFVCAGIAPDVLKKLITLRLGGERKAE